MVVYMRVLMIPSALFYILTFTESSWMEKIYYNFFSLVPYVVWVRGVSNVRYTYQPMEVELPEDSNGAPVQKVTWYFDDEELHLEDNNQYYHHYIPWTLIYKDPWLMDEAETKQVQRDPHNISSEFYKAKSMREYREFYEKDENFQNSSFYNLLESKEMEHRVNSKLDLTKGIEIKMEYRRSIDFSDIFAVAKELASMVL
eukprot:TRINITY_DN2578_c0_g1_i3.p1 TRINITY_DN2578_c0_g1~~TRINITY_DN2578_c0_g1_i3.p1  ORF type:complete len:200 (-),score=34.25 TRINITY_DN2578_c0_g1_i3:74-673(-)